MNEPRSIEDFLDDFEFAEKARERIRNSTGWCLIYLEENTWKSTWNTGPTTPLELVGVLERVKGELLSD